MIPGGIVVLMVDPAVVVVVRGAVPDSFEAVRRLLGIILHFLQEGGGGLLAPAVGSGPDPEGFVEEVLSADRKLFEAGEAGGRVVRAVHVDVNPAGFVRHRAGLHELHEDRPDIGEIFVLEDRGDNFTGVVPAPDGEPSGSGGSLGSDGTVAHGLPLSAFGIAGGVGVVTASDMAEALPEVFGDDLRGLLSGDAREFDFDSEVLGGCGDRHDFFSLRLLGCLLLLVI